MAPIASKRTHSIDYGTLPWKITRLALHYQSHIDSGILTYGFFTLYSSHFHHHRRHKFQSWDEVMKNTPKLQEAHYKALAC